MLSYKFIVPKIRTNSLRLRLVNNRKKTEISLGFHISEEDLADVLSPRPKPQNLKWKKLLSSIQADIDEIRCDLLHQHRSQEDVKIIKAMVLKKCFGVKDVEVKGKFVQHFQHFIDSKTNAGTKGIYEHTLSRIRLFDPNINFKSFEDINLRWLTEFETFCAQTASKNARNIHLRNIRAVFNSAIDYEITSAYPFRRFKIRAEPTRKRALSIEALRSLFEYSVEPYAEIYRDMFKLIFMLIGINTVDLHRLKTLTGDRIEYKRAKTGRLYSIKVEPEAQALIDKYSGSKGLLCIADRWTDHRNFQHQCNKALQRIGKVERKGRGGKKNIEVKFPGLTTYWARHTWATVAYSIGISKDVIAQALGHSDGHDTTNIYIDESTDKVDEANRRVLDWVLYGER